MNTTERGNAFEAKSYDLIDEAIQDGKLGIYAAQAKLFRKKGYYSKDRNTEIIFDLSVEIWPPGATNYTLLYLIECKSYDPHTVPVNDMEEFYAKIDQVSGVNAKGIFITDKGYQSGALAYAKSKGMMLIQVNFDSTYQIVLYKIQREKTAKVVIETWDDIIDNFLSMLFHNNSRIEGLKRLRTEDIEERAMEFLESMDSSIIKGLRNIPKDQIIQFLEKKFGIKTVLETSLDGDTYGNKVLGYFDSKSKVVYLDRQLVDTERLLFVLGHEVGHIVLHSELKINQQAYIQFKDSEYNFALGKHDLKNDKNWIEWQANQFSAALIMPKASLVGRLIQYQEWQGIRNAGTMFYDNQPVNQADFYKTIFFLANYFNVSFTSIKYRLSELGILKDERSGVPHWTNYFREGRRI